ncbi:MAG: desulfoferrodoxin [Candidatus Omnitrophica bacterium]|nr:desulfoferrodoxin [Candidatus Omnitrophota bacterium]
MNLYVCGKCGYIAFEVIPEACPVCGAKKEAFEQDNSAIKSPVDPNNLSELEKKHIPVIKIERKCGLIDSGCLDVNIKIGEIIHPMQSQHFIMYIDVYLDKNFISRYHLTAEKLNPALGIHLKVKEGKLLVLENCNLHGRWITEKDI